MLDSRLYLQMSTGKMRPIVPVPKRANGFSIDSIMGKDDGDRPGTSSDESEQGDEPVRPINSPEDIQRLMGFGSRLPPLHPALPTHVQQLLLSEPTARANHELLAARSQAWAIGNQHLGAFPNIGAVAGSGLGITPNPYQGLHHPGASVHMGLLPSTRDPLSLYPWMIARQGPSLMGLPYGPTDGGFFFHPYRKPKRIRTAFSPAQLLKLEQAFEKNHYVVGQERKELASKLSLTETQVKVWFQNRRTKHKRVKSDDEEGDNENISVEDDDDIISPRSHSEADEHETFQDGRR